MKPRIAKEYVDSGFGFPVIITNVPMVKYGNDEIALINYKKLEALLIKSIPSKSYRLSGAEVRFIRQHFGLTLQEFGKVFGVTHAGVLKWESCGNSACLSTATESMLRMWVQRRLSEDSEKFMGVWDKMLQAAGKPSKDTQPPIIPYSKVAAKDSVLTL